MTLKEITQRIQESQSLAASNPSQALKLNRELFLDIARQDELYLVPEANVSDEALEQKLFRPYIAPVQENDPRLFLRIFSHKDTATSFAERLNQDQVCQIDGVEMIQLAKSYFLRGVYGFLLNDGLSWSAVSFPDFLDSCFCDILGDPSLARPEFVTLIQFINMVRQNQYYHIQMGRQDTVDANKPVWAVFTDQPHGIWFDTPGEWLYEECSLNHLAQVSDWDPNSLIRIKTAKADLQTSPDLLRAALCAAGISDPGVVQYDLDFHINSVALDYQVRDFDLARLPLRTQLAELPRLEEPEPETEAVADKVSDKKETLGKGMFRHFLTKLFDRHTKKRKGPPQVANVEPDEDILDIPLESSTEPVSEPVPEPKPQKTFRIPSGKIMVGIFACIAIIIVAMAVVTQLTKPAPKAELEKAVEAGSYTEVVSLYDKCVTKNPGEKEELLQYMAADLQSKLEAYAADEITANQLAEVIASYEQIKPMASKCDAVYIQAAALEQSKLTYQQGLLETSMTARLSIWRGVIVEDTGSQKAIRTSLDKDTDVYKTAVYTEIASMEVGDALSALNVLQSYYPNDNSIAKHIKEWLDTVSKPTAKPSGGTSSGPTAGNSSDWPIVVQGITVTPGEGGAVGQLDLHIKWKNCSGQEIERVLFSVTPLDESGAPVYAEDGSYSEYMAIAQGPYEDGYEMPETIYWPAAWINESVKTVPAIRLNSVQIWYSSEEDWVSHDAVLYGELPEPEGHTEPTNNPLDILLGIS